MPRLAPRSAGWAPRTGPAGDNFVLFLPLSMPLGRRLSPQRHPFFIRSWLQRRSPSPQGEGRGGGKGLPWYLVPGPWPLFVVGILAEDRFDGQFFRAALDEELHAGAGLALPETLKQLVPGRDLAVVDGQDQIAGLEAGVVGGGGGTHVHHLHAVLRLLDVRAQVAAALGADRRRTLRRAEAQPFHRVVPV